MDTAIGIAANVECYEALADSLILIVILTLYITNTRYNNMYIKIKVD